MEAISAYRIVPAPQASEEKIALLQDADVFTFMSGETLACFFDVVPGGRALLDRKKVAVIGPIAKERAEALNVRVDLMPAEPTAEALVAVLTDL